MEEKKASKKKTSSAKKIVIGFLGVGLIVGVTIIGTLAFLNATSETKTNTFTASGDIVLGLDEPSYNVDDSGDVVDSSKPNPLDYQPETTYDKDPTLYNLTGDASVEEWVALRVDYGIKGNSGDVESVTYSQLTQDGTTNGFNGKGGIINDIDFDENWIQLTPAQIISLDTVGMAGKTVDDVKYDIFIYKYKIKAETGITSVGSASGFTESKLDDSGNVVVGGKTTPLFSSITVKSKQTLIDNGYVENGLLKAETFKIIVKGAAAKNDSTVETGFDTIDNNHFGDSTSDSYEIAASLVSLLNGKTPTFN